MWDFIFACPSFLQSSHWIGTIILSTCELIERPSKKDGFCFKLFHPMDQSIWAAKGKCNYRLIAGRQLKAEISSITISIYLVMPPNGGRYCSFLFQSAATKKSQQNRIMLVIDYTWPGQQNQTLHQLWYFCDRSGGWVYGCCCPTSPDLPLDLPGAQQRSRQVLDGRPGTGAEVFKPPSQDHELNQVKYPKSIIGS